MKHLTIILLTILICCITSCVKEDTFSGSKISYEDALASQSIRFSLNNEIIETNEVNEVPFQPFFCFDLPSEECEEGSNMYYKSFLIWLNAGTDQEIKLVMMPGIMIPEVLISYPNQNYFDSRPEFNHTSNIGQLYLSEGIWFSEQKKVKFHLGRGKQETNFYADYVLKPTDQFDITEIQEINDKENSYLIHGLFNLTIPDGRTWLPVNEQSEPQNLTGGSFSIIIQPLEK